MLANELLNKIKENFDSLYDFMEDYGDITQEKFLNDNCIIFVENQDQDISESYDFTDELLRRIYKHTPTGNYFLIEGRNQSYSGTNWNTITDVKEQQKTVTYYE